MSPLTLFAGFNLAFKIAGPVVIRYVLVSQGMRRLNKRSDEVYVNNCVLVFLCYLESPYTLRPLAWLRKVHDLHPDTGNSSFVQ
jgi:hypothetical protein